MNKPSRYFLALLATYLLAWTASYTLIMGSDFRYYLEYFRLAWTFDGLEFPTYIWLFSVAIFVPLATLIVMLMKRYERQRQNVA